MPTNEYSFLAEPIEIINQNWPADVLPLVSISCITFNHEPHIKDAIEGFLMQKTTFRVEILIYDDASTDQTAEIIKEYHAKHFSIIKPIFQNENQFSKGIRGMSIRFNYPRASGKYIALCEGDDYWSKSDKLQKQIEFLESNTEFSGCFTNAYFLDDINDEKRVYVDTLSDGEVEIKDIINRGGYLYPTASLVFRINNFDPLLNSKIIGLPGDTLLIFNLALKGRIYFMNEITCVYRRWSGGIHSSIAKDRIKLNEIRINAVTGYLMLNQLSGGKYKILLNKKISRISLAIVKYSNHSGKYSYFKFMQYREIIRFVIWQIKKTIMGNLFTK